MSDIQICLLSEQPSPNICPLLDERLKPKEVIMLVTPQQAKRMGDVEAVLKRRNFKVQAHPVESAFDAEIIQQEIESLILQARQHGKTVSINATGGTKPMSIGAFLAGFNHDVPVFYVNNDEVSWLHNPDRQSGFAIDERLKLDDFLRMHGIELQRQNHQAGTPKALQDFTDYLIRHPDLQASIKSLNRIAVTCLENAMLTHQMTDRELADKALQAVLDRCAEYQLITLKGKTLNFLSESNCRWLAGLWLEDHVFHVMDELRKQPSLQIQDLAESVEVIYAGKARSQQAKVDNELDILFLADNRLFVIECKTRVFSGKTNNNASEAIYKLATLKRELGGSQARAMFVSYYPIRDEDKRRADLLGVELCTGRQLQELPSRLRKWISLR